MSMTGSVSRTTTQFFVATAVMEASAGLALLIAPALVITLLLAGPVTSAAVAMGRWAGTALLSLGVACWGARADADSAASRGLVVGLFVYNAAVIVVALTGTFGPPSRRILLVLILLHGAMDAWCVWLLRSRR